MEPLSDPCVYIHTDMMVLTYVDDCILVSEDGSVIDEFIASLTDGPDKCVFTNEDTMSTYLGVDISPLPNKKGFVLSQPHLLGRIIETLNVDPKSTKKARGNIPVALSPVAQGREWTAKESFLKTPVSYWNPWVLTRHTSSWHRNAYTSMYKVQH